MKKMIAAVLMASVGVGVIGLGVSGSAPAQAIPVFDASNYAQNLLIAARSLTQVNQQVQQLQNEAQMLANMGKNLSRIDFPQLQELQQKMQEIDRLMGEAQGLNFKVGELDKQYQKLFPQSFDNLLHSDSRVAAARARLDAAAAQFRQSMGVQSKIVDNVQNDAEALNQIVSRSQGAEGALQVSQATNQLLALAAKQQFQLQQLVAAQFRSDAIDQARRAQSELEGKEMTRRFLGDGKAYTPR
jgi:P-type conjugative transfer protein TrbJ